MAGFQSSKPAIKLVSSNQPQRQCVKDTKIPTLSNMCVKNKWKRVYKRYSVEDESKVEQAVKWWKEERNRAVRDAAQNFSLNVYKLKHKWLEPNWRKYRWRENWFPPFNLNTNVSKRSNCKRKFWSGLDKWEAKTCRCWLLWKHRQFLGSVLFSSADVIKMRQATAR